MLDYKIIEYKKNIRKNGETYIDLLSNSFDKDLPIDAKIVVVNKYYVARPDLISLALYGSDRYADAICKINGISNPFELNEDDILLAPTFEYIEKYSKVFDASGSDLVDENEDDDEILKIKNTMQKRPNEKRSANEQLVGESNYVVDKSLGIILY